MDVEELAIVAALLIIKRKTNKKKSKEYWVHPLLEERRSKGMFKIFYEDVRKYPRKFFNYARMSVSSFDVLLCLLKPHITGIDTNMRPCISPEEKLFITLRYLGSGCKFVDLHYSYILGISTIAEIIREVCHFIWVVLKDMCLPQPRKENWLKIAKDFHLRANFPNCIGAVDGKHVRIIKPYNSGSLCYNYKHFFSVILLAICDSDYKFIYIDVGSYGKDCDSTIFTNSTFYQKLMNNDLQIPEPKPISSTNPIPVPFVIVGDEAFGQTDKIMRPFGGSNLTTKKKIFNYRLSRARRHIECSFGILANKWQIFHRPINVNLDLVSCIIKTCCALHNYVRERDGYKFEDTLSIPGFEEVPNGFQRATRRGASYRDVFADYFTTEGQLSWQMSSIN
ncbi:unnamed protein product [Parnassius mnemosyne]|uniref:DDE Tnp4 domain-containing protein n=1 Tax=Parnassius mnemosyne TaxID=213953 RepID=A0AAV1L9X5_9NEOP